MAYVDFQSKARSILSELPSDKKLEKLRSLRDNEISELYALCSQFVDTIYRIEFNYELPEHGKWIKTTIDSFRARFSGAVFEEKFLRELFYDVIPVFYHAEKERVSVQSYSVTSHDLEEFLHDLFECAIKGLPESGEIDLKTYELKRYPKTRVDLDVEDQLYLSDDKGSFRIVQACVFQVNRLKVLCGFFSEDRTWRSEKYVPEEKLSAIAKKHQLVKRKLD